MKVVVAIDSFKGCMTSEEANYAVQRGIKAVISDCEVIKIPIADGGEGTVHSFLSSIGGKLITIEVTGPLFKKVSANYGILPDNTAVIEMAEASGLTKVPKELQNPMLTTTYGVGELIIDAINRGCRNFIIGIGGSATNDAGMGMLKALGYRFFSNRGENLSGIGESLTSVIRIDNTNIMKELKSCHFAILCDVDNPLYGVKGAAYVYARQKGANDDMIKILDEGLRIFSDVVYKQYGKDINISGAGAAGGLGGGFLGFLNAELKSGIEIIFNKLNIESKVRGADYLITGEGKMDFQSVMGKVPMGIAQIGKRLGIPVIGICGTLTLDAEKLHDYGITALFSIINSPMTLSEAMDNSMAKVLVERCIREVFRLIKGG